jgi:hypothetical protein
MQALRLALVLFLFAVTVSLPATGGSKSSIASDSNRLAIRGYDAVAYFTESKAIQGTSEYEFVWEDAKWWFVSPEHRDIFVADPYRYMPQFGGYCAAAMAEGMLLPANPEAWTIVDGKLYMLADSPDAVHRWKANLEWYIPRASKEYAKQVSQ